MHHHTSFPLFDTVAPRGDKASKFHVDQKSWFCGVVAPCGVVVGNQRFGGRGDLNRLTTQGTTTQKTTTSDLCRENLELCSFSDII
jgi:hypothetical protein